MCKYDVRQFTQEAPAMMTAGSPARLPRRSHARSNHARILAAAREELSRDPDTSLDEIARAAGVVRRTLYGHFPNRQALLAALAELTLAIWAVGDRYRMLIALGRRDLGEESIHAALAPARAEATAILDRGQRDGTFAADLPAPVLALAVEAFGLAVLESQWPDPGGQASATAVLTAAGVAPSAARRYVRAVLPSAAP